MTRTMTPRTQQEERMGDDLRAKRGEGVGGHSERLVELEARRKASLIRLRKEWCATADHFDEQREQRESRLAAWLELPLEQRQASRSIAARR